MTKRRPPRLAFVAAVTAFFMAFGGVAVADNTVADGDNTVPVAASPLAIGTVCINSTTDAHALVAISRQGSGTNTFKNGTTVTVSVLSVSGTGLSASMETSSITLPSNWVNENNGTMSAAVSSKVTYAAGAATGSFSGSVTYRATGLNGSNATITRDTTMAVSATRSNTGACAPAPTDTTNPTVTVSFPSPITGSNGYFNADDVLPVEGTVTASDASNVTNISCTGATLSGVTGYNTNTASGTLTVSGDGTHNVSCSATDGATPANTGAATGSANTATIKIDATAPAITDGGFDSGTAGSNGWYTSAVTNKFSASDATSGLAAGCSANFTKSSGTDEGSAVKISSGSCSDNAGNTNNGIDSEAYKIDSTGPTAALAVVAGTAGANGWYTSNVTVRTSGSDTISGPVVCTADQSQTTETAGEAFNGSCTNQAGLSTNASSITVKLDKTGPTASLSATGILGNNNWYTSDITIETNGSDTISAPVTCTANQSMTSDTTGQTFNGSCTNDAGLTTNADPLTVKRDATKPTINPSVSPSPVVLNGSATASANASDATSGVASQSCDAVDTSSVGSKSVSCSAEDNAGNTNSAPASYSVVYDFSGFFRPVDNLPTLNSVKAGQAIPVKFSLGGNQGLNVLAAGFPTSKVIACGSTADVDTIEETVTAGQSSLSYDPVADQYSYVWKTDKSWANSCRTLSVKLADGSVTQANFKFIK